MSSRCPLSAAVTEPGAALTCAVGLDSPGRVSSLQVDHIALGESAAQACHPHWDVGSSGPVPAVVPGRHLRCRPQPGTGSSSRHRSCRRPRRGGPQNRSQDLVRCVDPGEPSVRGDDVESGQLVAGEAPRARQDAHSPTKRQSGDADSWQRPGGERAIPAAATASYTSMSRVPAPTVAVPPDHVHPRQATDVKHEAGAGGPAAVRSGLPNATQGERHVGVSGELGRQLHVGGRGAVRDRLQLDRVEPRS